MTTDRKINEYLQVPSLTKVKKGAKLPDQPGTSEVSDEQAIELHPLKYTTSCGGQDADKAQDAQNNCVWCKQMLKGCFTLRRKKHLVGYVIDQNNKPKIVNLAKPTLADNIMELKSTTKRNKWIELYVGKINVGGTEMSTVRARWSKDIIKDLEQLDQEFENENDFTLEDLQFDDDNPNDNYLTKYWDGNFVKDNSEDFDYGDREEEELDTVD